MNMVCPGEISLDINSVVMDMPINDTIFTYFLLERIDSIETMPIKQVACGQDFTMALSDKGKVLSWGNNRSGQLGHPILDIIQRPRYVQCKDTEYR